MVHRWPDQKTALRELLRFYQRAELREGEQAQTAERIRVELALGGKATLRDPEERFTVIFRFLEQRAGQAALSHIEVVPDDERSLPAELDLLPYWRAFGREVRERPSPDFRRIPRRRPRAGRGLDTAFYQKILDQYEALRRSGSRAPALELAKQMNETPERVRLWVHRARKYLEQGDK